jgi:hypothetical protein
VERDPRLLQLTGPRRAQRWKCELHYAGHQHQESDGDASDPYERQVGRTAESLQ